MFNFFMLTNADVFWSIIYRREVVGIVLSQYREMLLSRTVKNGVCNHQYLLWLLIAKKV